MVRKAKARRPKGEDEELLKLREDVAQLATSGGRDTTAAQHDAAAAQAALRSA